MARRVFGTFWKCHAAVLLMLVLACAFDQCLLDCNRTLRGLIIQQMARYMFAFESR